MPGDPFEALRAQLGGTAPEGLRELDDTQLADLTAAVRAARQRELSELAQAEERALKHIPRLLRGPVRRIVG